MIRPTNRRRWRGGPARPRAEAACDHSRDGLGVEATLARLAQQWSHARGDGEQPCCRLVLGAWLARVPAESCQVPADDGGDLVVQFQRALADLWVGG